MVAASRFLALGALLICSGCGLVPLTSIAQLSRVDPGTTDPAALRLAIRLPEAVRPRPGGVALEATLRVEGEPEVARTFALAAADDDADVAGLPAPSAGFETHSFRLGPGEAVRLEALRRSFDTARDAKRKGSLSIGVRATAFCRAAPAPVGDVLMTAYLRTVETSSYVVLVRDVEIWSRKDAAAAIAALDPC